MARISIIGIGYVGVVAAGCLARDGHSVLAVDIDQSKVDAINSGVAPIVELGLPELIMDAVKSGRLTATKSIEQAIKDTDLTMICVGTPSTPEGSVGLQYVLSALEAVGVAIAQKQSFHSVIVRSTIVPGSMLGHCIPALEKASGLKAGADFGVGYYPEFLRESTAIEDYYDPGLIVFGTLDEQTAHALTELNKDLPCPIHSVSISTAETIKYASNSWRAVKVTFANEIGNIAKACSVDGQEVMSVLCSDKKVNISSYFMRPGFAFGGSCLPKDIRALRYLANTKGVMTPLLDSVLLANGHQIERAEILVDSLGGKKVGMVGISFKPGTDDLRESPLAELASRLIKRGYSLKVYDPYVHTAYEEEMAGAGRGCDAVPDLADRLVGNISDLIAGSDIIVLGNKYDQATDALAVASQSMPIVDLVRLNKSMRSNGRYEGICW